MQNDSWLSIIILFVIFFVLPSLLKLLGQFTLNSKGGVAGGDADRAAMDETGAEAVGHPDTVFPKNGEESSGGKVQITNRPITPKWF